MKYKITVCNGDIKMEIKELKHYWCHSREFCAPNLLRMCNHLLVDRNGQFQRFSHAEVSNKALFGFAHRMKYTEQVYKN